MQGLGPSRNRETASAVAAVGLNRSMMCRRKGIINMELSRLLLQFPLLEGALCLRKPTYGARTKTVVTASVTSR